MSDIDKWIEGNPGCLEGMWQINMSVAYEPSGYPNELLFSVVIAATHTPVDLMGVTAINIAARGPKDILVRKTIGDGITLPFAKDGNWSVWLDHHEVDELTGKWFFCDLEILCGKFLVKTTSDELFDGHINLQKLPPRTMGDEGKA